jgi:hypothetical protein
MKFNKYIILAIYVLSQNERSSGGKRKSYVAVEFSSVETAKHMLLSYTLTVTLYFVYLFWPSRGCKNRKSAN